MSLSHYIESIYGMYKDKEKEWQDSLDYREQQLGHTVPSYLRDVVFPSLRDPANTHEALYHDLQVTKAFYLYHETTDEPHLVDIDERTKKMSIRWNDLEKYLLRKFCIVTFNKVMYIYKNGAFYEDKGQARAACKKALDQRGWTDQEKFEMVWREMAFRLQTISSQPEYPFNARSELLSCKNGVLILGTWIRLLPQSPLWGFTFTIPVTYRPEVETNELEGWLAKLVRKDEVPYLLQIPAQALLHKPTLHLAYLLVGSGANGKSTYLTLVRKLLGEENTTSIPLNELCNDSFAGAGLQDKVANICADIPKKPVKNSGKFKLLTGGDKVSVQRKFCDRTELRNRATMIFSANELPEVDDDTYAWWRRWVVLEFPHIFRPNAAFEDNFMTEHTLSAFLKLVLRDMLRIQMYGLKEADSAELLRENWKKRSNAIYAWGQEEVIKDPDGYVAKTLAYKSCCSWAKERGFTLPTLRAFNEHMQRIGAVDSYIGPPKGRIRVWKGIRLKSELDAEEGERPPVTDEFARSPGQTALQEER